MTLCSDTSVVGCWASMWVVSSILDHPKVILNSHPDLINASAKPGLLIFPPALWYDMEPEICANNGEKGGIPVFDFKDKSNSMLFPKLPN